MTAATMGSRCPPGLPVAQGTELPPIRGLALCCSCCYEILLSVFAPCVELSGCLLFRLRDPPRPHLAFVFGFPSVFHFGFCYGSCHCCLCAFAAATAVVTAAAATAVATAVDTVVVTAAAAPPAATTAVGVAADGPHAAATVTAAAATSAT